MWLFGFLVGMGVGGAAIWYGKTMIQTWILGAEAVASKLQATVTALKAKV
jgi:hypothetical protein